MLTANVLRDDADNVEFVGAVTDITERRRAEAVIREREAELLQILDFAPWHVAVLGADGKAIVVVGEGVQVGDTVACQDLGYMINCETVDGSMHPSMWR